MTDRRAIVRSSKASSRCFHSAVEAGVIVEGVGVVGFDFARFIEGADRLFFSA